MPPQPQRVPAFRHPDALCLGLTPLFFPESNDSDTLEQAREVCHACRARSSCLEHALRYRSLKGIWGGTSLREREKIRQEIRRERSTSGR